MRLVRPAVLMHDTQVCVEPLRNQHSIRLPPGPCVPHALAHDESSRHVHLVQSVDQSPRSLKWDGLVCVSRNENRGRIVGGDVRNRRELTEHPEYGLRIGDERTRTRLLINIVKLKTRIDGPALA